jgi:hypothetical protein
VTNTKISISTRTAVESCIPQYRTQYLSTDGDRCSSSLARVIYCPFAHKWGVVLVDPLSPNLCTEGNFQDRFLDVNRYSFRNSIDLLVRRVYLRYLNISTRIFGDSVSCLGLYGGLYGQNLPYKFKKSYGDFRNRNFEKSYRTTGPRSDMRPDS